MIFGRKKQADAVEETPDEAVLDETTDEPGEIVDDVAELDEDGGDLEPVDPRWDGPFDYEEVDLDDDEALRISFGPLIVTPFEGVGLQLHGDETSGEVLALLAVHEGSGLEVALFAAPTSGGLASELQEDTIDEAEHAGGSAGFAEGPFGPEVQRVMPMEGPEGEQLFHVSRIRMAEGPGWLLRGTLMGQAATVEGEEPPAYDFVEFFRNIVVRRDNSPRVPGELITLAIPDGIAAEG